VSSPLLHQAPDRLRRRLTRTLGFLLAHGFLLVNLVARAHALHASGPAKWDPFLVSAGLGSFLCLMRPTWLGPAILLFGVSSFLYGFHSYGPQSQALELLVTTLSLVLLLRLLRGSGSRPAPARPLLRPLRAHGHFLAAAAASPRAGAPSLRRRR
jgi:hypothetical protein